MYPELIKLHNNIVIAAGVSFITHDVTYYVINKCFGSNFKEKIGCIEIMDNIFIGSNSTILYDVRIGSKVIVAARSVVTKDIPQTS